MAIHNPIQSKGGRPPGRPILRAEIEEAQQHTNSNKQAARYLNVPYKRYKQYAQLYGIFERHLNMKGIGIEKGFSKNPTSIPLRDILAGKHPTYSLSKLKNRLLARKKISEVCSLCGFYEQRITDKKVPLMLTFADQDRSNFQLSNLLLMCYNCMFLTTGAPSVVNRSAIHRSLTYPYTAGYHVAVESTVADGYESQHTPHTMLDDVVLTDAEYHILLTEHMSTLHDTVSHAYTDTRNIAVDSTHHMDHASGDGTSES